MSVPATVDLVRVTMEDLAFLRSYWDQDVSDASLRRSSPIFRRLLVENHLQLCWNYLGLDKQPIIRAVSLEVHLSRIDLQKITYAQAGGAVHSGAAVIVPTEVNGFLPPDVARQVFGSPDDSPERDLSLKAFLDSACIVARGTKVSRRTLIKYVANKLGGVHFDPKRNLAKEEGQQFALLDEIRDQRIVADKPAIYFELLSVGQALLDSPDIAMFLVLGAKAGFTGSSPLTE